MEIASTGWHYFSAVLIFIIGIVIALQLGKQFQLPKYRVLALYLWHTVFCIIYMLYVFKSGGDSLGYFQHQYLTEGYRGSLLGTHVVGSFSYFLVNYISLSLLGVFLVFNLFGVIGLLAFDASLQSATYNSTRTLQWMATLVVFLPSVSFWSSAIGKDAIVFMTIGIILWSAINIQKRKILLFVAIGILMLIRPHIASLLIIAITVVLFMEVRKLGLLNRLAFVVIVIPAAFSLVVIAADYAGLLTSLDINYLISYIETRQDEYVRKGGRVDIGDMLYPIKVFTYLFRPLPHEAHNFYSLFSSIENVILLCIFVFGLIAFRFKYIDLAKTGDVFLSLYIVQILILLPIVTINYGIAARQKWMVVPMIMYFIFSVLSKHEENKSLKGNIQYNESNSRSV